MASGKTDLRQEQRLRLQQRLNPKNLALGRLLEMSVPELEDEIRRELDDNPALEATGTDASAPDNDFNESSEQLQMADYASEDDLPSYITGRSHSNSDFDITAIAPDEGDSMIDALMRRLRNEFRLSDTDSRIAAQIIGNLDDGGYLERPLWAIADEIAMTEGFEPSHEDVRRVFDAIRSLDPAGIGAVDLRDCLLLQLDRLEPSVRQKTAREIIANNFDLFSKKHFPQLQAQLEISKEALADALELIRSLNPKPASALDLGHASDQSRHVTPDAAVDYDSTSDAFTITLLGSIPELGIEESFAAVPTSPENLSDSPAVRQRQRQALAFIRRKHDDAAAFIGLIRMRAETLMIILKAIVSHQHDFFVSGDTIDIKPMILKDISGKTGLDISVISRATAGKYVQTSHGLYPLKMFFNERPDNDTDVSSHEILTVLKDLIDKEDKHTPLTDQSLCDYLNSRGYDLARRTVSKYREKLGFPVARLRRQL